MPTATEEIGWQCHHCVLFGAAAAAPLWWPPAITHARQASYVEERKHAQVARATVERDGAELAARLRQLARLRKHHALRSGRRATREEDAERLASCRKPTRSCGLCEWRCRDQLAIGQHVGALETRRAVGSGGQQHQRVHARGQRQGGQHQSWLSTQQSGSALFEHKVQLSCGGAHIERHQDGAGS